MQRAIHIFPRFAESGSINLLRSEYDPLASLIPPHVTLVFPFHSNVSTNEVQQHILSSVSGMKPFRMVAEGLTGAENEYLFLNVKVGNDEIIELHDRLYTGILQQYLNRERTYIPHITVGRFQNETMLQRALAATASFNEAFETTVDEVVAERIDESGKSLIECTVALGR